MRGTRRYYKWTKPGLYKRLYVTKDKRPGGNILRVFVVPGYATWASVSRPPGHAPFVARAVEVFGIISGEGTPNETYGWIHQGPWVDDFEKLIEKWKTAIKAEETAEVGEHEAEVVVKRDRVAAILAGYKAGDGN